VTHAVVDAATVRSWILPAVVMASEELTGCATATMSNGDTATTSHEEQVEYFVQQLVKTMFLMGTCNAPQRAFERQIPCGKVAQQWSPTRLVCIAFCAIRVTHDRGGKNQVTTVQQRAIARIVKANPPLLRMLLLETFCLQQMMAVNLYQLIDQDFMYDHMEIWTKNDKKQMVYLPETRCDVLSTLVTRKENWDTLAKQFVTDSLTMDDGFTLTYHIRYSLEEPNDLDRFMHLAKKSTEANPYRGCERMSSFISWIIWMDRQTTHFENEADKKIFLRRLFDHVTTMAQDFYAHQLRFLLTEFDSTHCRLRGLMNNTRMWMQSTQNKWRSATHFPVIHDFPLTICVLKLSDIDF